MYANLSDHSTNHQVLECLTRSGISLSQTISHEMLSTTDTFTQIHVDTDMEKENFKDLQGVLWSLVGVSVSLYVNTSENGIQCLYYRHKASLTHPLPVNYRNT
uniref:Uncharacterized protein n=1 Tax=Trichobilharzia regenti TaxID=157069 RepID=A0AA85J400_TRIRE|nr:unnamed protein product [Trichobilharzia regenti]